ncbi:MAG TPA: protein-export chaperone SecB [Anaerovoracaceae bacterium]|nr:protein-export chaperone SecB [Anaerovoracaceae bacterium]
MNILKDSESILKVRKIIIEKMSLERSTGDITSGELESNFKKDILEIEKDKYKVSLELLMNNEDKTLMINIKVTGMFEFESEIDGDVKKDLIEQNTISILFPYIRTQVTLLTSQPGMQPIVIPPININALLENLSKNDHRS